MACLSIAAKMEETVVPLLLDLQLFEEPRFVFEPGTVGRMEVLVMARLQWRMRSVTPFDFIDSFAARLQSFCAGRNLSSSCFFSRVSDLILSTHRGNQNNNNNQKKTISDIRHIWFLMAFFFGIFFL